MVEIQNYMETMTRLLRERFGSRLLYVGLQGSYLRGEATENSDIDVMTVLENVRIPDLDAYRAVKNAMEEPEKACGFLCGREELSHWNPMEICHLLHTTRDFYGSLKSLVPAYTDADVRNFVKMSVNNLYHELCHRYIYADREKNVSHLPGTYKCVFFVLQNLHYLETGLFAQTKGELLTRLSGKDRAVLARAMDYGNADFEESFSLLLSWCQEKMHAL